MSSVSLNTVFSPNGNLGGAYDLNQNGVVDNAELVNGLSVETAVPPNAEFGNTVTEVVDNLITQDAAKALSSNQGYVLKGILDALVVDDVATNDGTKALSAAQGLYLKGLIDNISASSAIRTTMVMDTSGSVDVTSVFQGYLATGGYYYIPAGDYLLSASGGGVDTDVAESLDILCHPNAIFHGGASGARLDNNVITLRANNTSASQGKSVSFKWVGGQGNVTYTNNGDGTTIPHSNTWPIQHVGTSTNADFLSVRGEWDGTPNWLQYFKSVHIEALYVTGGTVGMESAGGDAGIFVDGGAEKTTIQGCYFKNLRGSGIYCSGGANTTLAARGLTIKDNLSVNTFNGASIKRGYTDLVVSGNIAINCVQNIQCNTVTVGPRRGIISDNISHNCWGTVRLDESHDLIVTNNLSSEMGFLLEGDVLPSVSNASPYGSFLHPSAIEVNGSGNNHIANNFFSGINSAYTLGTTQPSHIVLNTAGGSTQSSHNYITNNSTVDGYYAIRDQLDSTENVYQNNIQRNNTIGNELLSTSHRLMEFRDTGFLDIQTDDISGIKLIENEVPSVAQTTWRLRFQGKINGGSTVNYSAIDAAAQNTVDGTGDVRVLLRNGDYMPARFEFDEVTLQAGYQSNGVGTMIVSIQDDRIDISQGGTQRVFLNGDKMDINAFLEFKAPPSASLPSASAYPNTICMESTTGKPVYSWGGAWRYVHDNSLV